MSLKKALGLGLIFTGVGTIFGYLLITFIVNRKPTAGLKVYSTPASVVYVDNSEVGQTPFEKTFPPGEVTVKLIPTSENQSITSYQTKVRLSENTYTVIHRDFGPVDQQSSGDIVTLLPQTEKTSSLAVVSSSPEFASVNLDGQTMGFTPLSVTSITPGDHKIVISAPGYLPRTISAVSLGNYRLMINAKLAQDSLPVALTDTPTPAISPIISPTPTSTVASVTILQTPVGFLRVRSGPNTSFSEVAQVHPGDKYELLTESGQWYQIRLDVAATSSGWISTQYAKKN